MYNTQHTKLPVNTHIVCFLCVSTYSDPLLQILQVAIPRKKGQSAN